MSLDRSLKSGNSLIRHRNVLTRAERLEVLADEEKWDDSKSVFGIPKVPHRKQALAKSVKEEAAADGTAVAGAAAPAAGAAAPAKDAKPAPGAKGAAPAAKDAKAAAPAAKKK
jgi:small basic protein (TIGR04137 family)